MNKTETQEALDAAMGERECPVCAGFGYLNADDPKDETTFVCERCSGVGQIPV